MMLVGEQRARLKTRNICVLLIDVSCLLEFHVCTFCDKLEIWYLYQGGLLNVLRFFIQYLRLSLYSPNCYL